MVGRALRAYKIEYKRENKKSFYGSRAEGEEGKAAGRTKKRRRRVREREREKGNALTLVKLRALGGSAARA